MEAGAERGTEELLLLSAESRPALAELLEGAIARADAAALPLLALELAARAPGPHRLAMVAGGAADFVAWARRALTALADPKRDRFNLGERVFYQDGSARAPEKVALLFPGFGAQHAGMLAGPLAAFATVRRWLDSLDRDQRAEVESHPLLFGDAADREPRLGEIAGAVLATNLALYELLTALGVGGDVMVGHSFGENAVLAAAGLLDRRRVLELPEEVEAAAHAFYGAAPRRFARTAMLAVASAPADLVDSLARREPPLFVALDNCPHQVVLCGEAGAIDAIEREVAARGGLCFRLPRLDQPIHTPLFPLPRARLRAIYDALPLAAPRLPVYSCSTAARFPDEPEALRALLADQWTTPVRLRATVEALYRDGVRVFVEVGPGARLTGFVRDTLRARDVLAVSAGDERRPAWLQVALLLAKLFARGRAVDLAHLHAERAGATDAKNSAREVGAKNSTREVDGEISAREVGGKISACDARAPFAADGAGDRGALLALVLRETASLLGRADPETEDGALDADRGFFELGLDSLAAVELTERLSARLGRRLPETAAFDHPTPRALAAHLAGAAPAPAPRASAPAAAAPREPIAILGIGCRLPGDCRAPEDFWRLLVEGRDAITEVPPDRWDAAALYDPDPDAPGRTYARHGGFVGGLREFDGEFFGIGPRECATLDPQQRLLLECAWRALEHAAIDPTSLARSATGVFVGISGSEYAARLDGAERLRIGGYLATGNLPSVAAGRISFALGLRGPCLAVDTACSSSLVAVHLACQSLRRGESDLALAGGVNALFSPELTIFLAKARALARDGRCKTFDARADGYVRSEGCGVLVLKRLGAALADGDPILAVIRGSASNHDGSSSGLTVPSGPAQAELIARALADAGVAPDEVGYVEAHGTGTALGDPIEVQALAEVFAARARERPLHLGSVKTNIGHLEAAAGVAGLIKTILQLRHGTLAPHLHLDTPNPKIPWARLPFRVNREAVAWRGRRIAGVSSFGLSGTNAHVVVEEAPAPRRAPAAKRAREHLFTLSAKSAPALAALRENHRALVASGAAPELADLCYTTNVGRAHFRRGRHRLALAAASLDELGAALEQAAPRPAFDGGGGVAFLFTGQGAQHPNMGRALYASEPVFRDALDACRAGLDARLPAPLLDVLFDDSDAAAARLARTEFTQPALFAVEWALAALWRSWGVEPAALAGHSIGELVAACVAGVFTLDDALALVAARGRLMQSLPDGGAMLAVRASEAALGEIGALDLAAVNAPEQLVLSGDAEAIEAARVSLSARGVACRRLAVSHAFHSRRMEPILGAFADAASRVRYQAPRIPIVSSRSGAAAGDELATPEYWVRQLRDPVRFAGALGGLHAAGARIFVELGPRPVLIGAAAETLPAGALLLASMAPPVEERRAMLDAAGRLYQAGVELDWARLHAPWEHRRVAIPTYPFQRETHWIETAPSAPSPAAAPRAPVPAADAAALRSLSVQLREAPDGERTRALRGYLNGVVGAVLGLRADRPPDPEIALNAIGLDSLMAMHVRNRLELDLGVQVPVVRFMEGLTLVALAAEILAQLAAAPAAPAAGFTEGEL